MDAAACQQFLNSYSSGALHQSLSQHACRLLALPQELRVEAQLKASTHTLDLCLDDLEHCLKHIHQSQVNEPFPGSWPVVGKIARIPFDQNPIWLDSCVLCISLNVCATRRSTIWSRCCRARPLARLSSSPTPTSSWSLPSPTTASDFRTGSLVSQSNLNVNLLYTHLIVFALKKKKNWSGKVGAAHFFSQHNLYLECSDRQTQADAVTSGNLYLWLRVNVDDSPHYTFIEVIFFAFAIFYSSS